MTIEKIETWKTSDGSLFVDKDSAERYEQVQSLSEGVSAALARAISRLDNEGDTPARELLQEDSVRLVCRGLFKLFAMVPRGGKAGGSPR